MRTIETKVYPFTELSEEAKEAAINSIRAMRYHWGYDWSEEWVDSLKSFCYQIGATLKEYSVSTCSPSYTTVSITRDEFDPEELTGLRLRTWLINNWLPLFRQGKYYSKSKWFNGEYKCTSRRSKVFFTYHDCPFTGYCGDNSLIHPVLTFIDKPDSRTSLLDLLQDCADSWVEDWVSDMEYQDSDEAIRETIEPNGYEFTEEGELI
jgi:hypothetical protein